MDEGQHSCPPSTSSALSPLPSPLPCGDDLARLVLQEMRSLRGEVQSINARVERMHERVVAVATTLNTSKNKIFELSDQMEELTEETCVVKMTTERILQRFPATPGPPEYEYLSAEEVDAADNDKILTFVTNLEKMLFDEDDMDRPWTERDRRKWNWMMKVVLYRKRESIGTDPSFVISTIKKRVNQYVMTRRKAKGLHTVKLPLVTPPAPPPAPPKPRNKVARDTRKDVLEESREETTTTPENPPEESSKECLKETPREAAPPIVRFVQERRIAGAVTGWRHRTVMDGEADVDAAPPVRRRFVVQPSFRPPPPYLVHAALKRREAEMTANAAARFYWKQPMALPTIPTFSRNAAVATRVIKQEDERVVKEEDDVLFAFQ